MLIALTLLGIGLALVIVGGLIAELDYQEGRQYFDESVTVHRR
jgi:hypothetical protein